MLAGRLHSATQAGGPEADNRRMNLDAIRPEPEPAAPAPEPQGRRATKDPARSGSRARARGRAVVAE